MKKAFKKLRESNKKVKISITCLVLAVVGFIAIAIVRKTTGNSDTSYRESQVVYGDLTVGISEDGSVDIGTVEQTFDLDMSALSRVTTSNSNSSSNSNGGMSGGMNGIGGNPGGNSGGDMFSQMFSMGADTSSSNKTNSDSKIKVQSIEVAVGQEIKEGDVVLVLESEGVEELKTELEDNVTKASADLEALVADQKLSKITADYTLETSLKYGEYAEKEKNESLASLQLDITNAQASLTTAKETLSRYEEQLAQAKIDYSNALIVQENSEWSRDHYSKDTELYFYCGAYNEAEAARSDAESLKSSVEQLESKVESVKSTVSRCQTTLAKAKRAYESGKITAEQNYEIKKLAYDTAQETYDITISYMEENLEKQQKTYDETLSKWNEFNKYIDGTSVVSNYSGVVTAVELEVGDGLDTGSAVVSLYNADDVTMTVTVDEEDLADIELDGLANVSLLAYPDEVFEAKVTEISDASTDSSGNTTRDVTVTIKGDMSKLYQGMTGDVTFITKETKAVLYVSNRAISRENGVSYVKVKDEKGHISKVKVETGFSDGVNVEIISGLSEGQTVIIEKGDAK